MLTRADLERREATTLAPYAVRSAQARREYPEAESQTRTAFQKDRDRVLHTTAFRRLEAKTQVFLNPQGDHYRTRLTHTLEVQQVARSIALNLGLNETLAETIALAHDLGHPPFGHAGERLLDKLMWEEGGFNHNLQARRIVTLLEDRYPAFPGLNLTLDTLDGLNKHQRAGLGPPSLEAQVVDAADALAYTAHDLDDGLRSGLLTSAQLHELPLWQELLKRLGITSATLSDLERRIIHRELLGWLIADLMAATESAIHSSGVNSAEEVRLLPHKLVTYSDPMREQLTQTAQFLRDNLYRHWWVERQVTQANSVLETLFFTFLERPELLPPGSRAHPDPADPAGLRRTVCDHLAGMTDRYALDVHMRLAAAPPPPNS